MPAQPTSLTPVLPHSCLAQEDGWLRLSERGLTAEFDGEQGVDFEIELAAMGLRDCTRMERTIRSRGPIRFSINPPSLPLPDLLATMKAAQAEGPTEAIGVGFEAAPEYDLAWHVGPGDEPNTLQESQTLFLVAFLAGRPAGFMHANLTVEQDQERSVTVSLAMRMVYVAPALRRQGVALEMSIATGDIMRDVLMATYDALGPEHTLDGYISGDIVSDGGEQFISYVAGRMEEALECCSPPKRSRKRARVGEVVFDAGW